MVDNNTHNTQSLPDGWVWTITREVCASVRDGTHDTPKYVDHGVPLITSKNLLKTGLDFNRTKNISFQDHEKISERSGVEKRDVLFAMIGTIGNPVVVRTDRAFSIKNVGLFKKNEVAISSDYLKYWLESPGFNSALEENEFIRGTTQRFVPLGNLRILPVPLAPLPEQRRIVAEIETQFTRLNAAVAALERAQATLRRYKASVLKAACEGRLLPAEEVRAIRESPDYEPADVLLRRILVERRQRWEEEQWRKEIVKAKKKAAQAKRKAVGLPARIRNLTDEEWQYLTEVEYGRYLPKDDKWKRKYKKPVLPETEDLLGLPDLPEGWVWTTAEQLSDETRAITYGVIKLGDPVADGIPTLRSSDVRHLYLDLETVKRISPEIANNYRRTFLQGGEILVTVRGTLGGVAVASAKCKGFNVSREVAVIALINPLIGSAISYFIGSVTIQNWLLRRAKGIAYTGINIETLKRTPIPLPPLPEQHRIVVKVERRLSLVAALETAVAANLRRAERLRQSILKRAFEGRLVPQDPNDEPASVLLARIQAQREAEGKSKKTSRKKKSRQLELFE